MISHGFREIAIIISRNRVRNGYNEAFKHSVTISATKIQSFSAIQYSCRFLLKRKNRRPRLKIAPVQAISLHRGIVLHHGFICLILRDCFQAPSRGLVQHQVGIGSRIVEEQVIRLGAFVHVVGESILRLPAVDGHDGAAGQLGVDTDGIHRKPFGKSALDNSGGKNYNMIISKSIRKLCGFG